MTDRALTSTQLRKSWPVQAAIRKYTEERKRAAAGGATITCWLCNQPVDMTLTDPLNDGHFEVDHLYPLADYPEHAADPGNFRDSHRGCNRQRSNSTTGNHLGSTSADWEGMATAAPRPGAARRGAAATPRRDPLDLDEVNLEELDLLRPREG